MAKIAPSWSANLPPEIEFPVGHLRMQFLKCHFKNGSITEQICFGILHSLGPKKSCHWQRDSLKDLESVASVETRSKLDSLIGIDSLSSVVMAFFDLYVDSLGPLAVDIFHKLLGIAASNPQHINSPPVAWAKAQTEDLIEWKSYLVRAWVRNVCDRREVALDSYSGPEWPEWEAPRFLVMEPLGETTSLMAQQEPFDSGTAWERLDATYTKFALLYFEHRYEQKLRITLRQIAGDAAVYMAMHGTPPPAPALARVPEDAKASIPTEDGKTGAGPKKRSGRPPNLKLAARKKKLCAASESHPILEEYAAHLDKEHLQITKAWVGQGCPGTYVLAVATPKWRKRVQGEQRNAISAARK